MVMKWPFVEFRVHHCVHKMSVTDHYIEQAEYCDVSTHC
jgi:hypothetical protein